MDGNMKPQEQINTIWEDAMCDGIVPMMYSFVKNKGTGAIDLPWVSEESILDRLNKINPRYNELTDTLYNIAQEELDILSKLPSPKYSQDNDDQWSKVYDIVKNNIISGNITPDVCSNNFNEEALYLGAIIPVGVMYEIFNAFKKHVTDWKYYITEQHERHLETDLIINEMAHDQKIAMDFLHKHGMHI